MISPQFEKKLGKGNLKKLLPTSINQELEAVFSPCCGLGRKIVRIVDSNGQQQSIKSFPVTIDGNAYASQQALEDGMAQEYGYGFVVKMLNPKKILVIGNSSSKNDDGTLNIPDTVEKS